MDKFYRRIKQWHDFQKFADKLTLQEASSLPLDTFRLRTSSLPLDTFRLRVSCADFVAAHRWILRALERRPAAFHLCSYNDDSLADDRKPSPRFFPDVFLHHHAGAYTRRLRTMFLSGLSLSSYFMDAVTAESPVLEDVHLRHCNNGFHRIISGSLKKLSMNNCRSLYGEEYKQLVLAVPRMVSLHINDHPPPIVSASEMRSLVSASLAHQAGDLGVLCSLCHARRLDLSGFSTTALLVKDPEPEDKLMFTNLRTLVLKSCELGAECQVVRRFLRNSPRLETLTLQDCTLSRGSWGKGRKKTSSKQGHLVDEVAKVLGEISKEAVYYQIVRATRSLFVAFCILLSSESEQGLASALVQCPTQDREDKRTCPSRIRNRKQDRHHNFIYLTRSKKQRCLAESIANGAPSLRRPPRPAERADGPRPGGERPAAPHLPGGGADERAVAAVAAPVARRACLDLDQFETAAGWAAFEDVADRLTLLHDASSPLLDTFRLSVGRPAFERARRWIRRALQRAPAAFDLHLIGRREYEGFPLDEWPRFPDSLVESPDADAFRVRLTTLHISGLRLSEEFGLALAVDSRPWNTSSSKTASTTSTGSPAARSRN
ncbi:hypothetical protein EJB05_37889, partial [Eragrostis curvula]